MIDRASLRLAGSLLIVGQVSYILVTLFHADGVANDHPAAFAEYARSSSWTMVHVGQFMAMAILIAGLLLLFLGLDTPPRPVRWTSGLGAGAAVVALALYGALQAVDGVANKQADIAWLSASGPEKAARFASAEAIRWIEWGMRSYSSFALGVALLFFAAAVATMPQLPRAIAYVMMLSGVSYLVQGWLVGTDGFSQAMSIAIVVAWVLSLVWMIVVGVVAWRLPDEVPSPRTTRRSA